MSNASSPWSCGAARDLWCASVLGMLRYHVSHVPWVGSEVSGYSTSRRASARVRGGMRPVVTSGPTSGYFGRVWAKVRPSRLDFGRGWATADRMWQRAARVRPLWCDLGRCCPDFGHVGPGLSRFGPISAEMWNKSGATRTPFGPARANIQAERAILGGELGRAWPDLGLTRRKIEMCACGRMTLSGQGDLPPWEGRKPMPGGIPLSLQHTAHRGGERGPAPSRSPPSLCCIRQLASRRSRDDHRVGPRVGFGAGARLARGGGRLPGGAAGRGARGPAWGLRAGRAGLPLVSGVWVSSTSCSSVSRVGHMVRSTLSEEALRSQGTVGDAPSVVARRANAVEACHTRTQDARSPQTLQFKVEACFGTVGPGQLGWTAQG